MPPFDRLGSNALVGHVFVFFWYSSTADSRQQQRTYIASEKQQLLARWYHTFADKILLSLVENTAVVYNSGFSVSDRWPTSRDSPTSPQPVHIPIPERSRRLFSVKKRGGGDVLGCTPAVDYSLPN